MLVSNDQLFLTGHRHGSETVKYLLDYPWESIGSGTVVDVGGGVGLCFYDFIFHVRLMTAMLQVV